MLNPTRRNPARNLPAGTRYTSNDGYTRVVNEAGRSVLEHRHVMEQMLGRPLRLGENVHHRNGVRTDNRPQNLELWTRVQPPGVRYDDHHCPRCRCRTRVKIPDGQTTLW